MRFLYSVLFEAAANEDSGEAARLYRGAARLAVALGVSALWGVAAACTHPAQALANVYKVPMVLLLSLLTTIPAAILLWKAFRVPIAPRELLLAQAASSFDAALVLGAFAPLIVLYAYTSNLVAPWLVQASAIFAIVVGFAMFVARVAKTTPVAEWWRAALPVGASLIIHLAALLQLVSVATPIVPGGTVFGQGADGFSAAQR